MLSGANLPAVKNWEYSESVESVESERPFSILYCVSIYLSRILKTIFFFIF